MRTVISFKSLCSTPTRRRPTRRSPPAWRLCLEALEGRALPGFVAPLSFDTGQTPESVAVADFNGDAIADLAVADAGGNSVSVLLGNGDGTFQPARDFGAGDNPVFVAAGDFNGDGHADLVVANNLTAGTVSVLLGNGDGTFQAAGTFAAGLFPSAVAVGDFNGDGVQDLAVANEDSGDVSVLLGNGDGTFQAAGTFAAGLLPSAVAVGDFNGDGVQDLAVANVGGGSANVSVLLGNGDGTFQAARNFDAGDNGPVSVAVGEFNGDGIQDLAVANVGGGSANVSVLLGNGDGTFQAAHDFAAGQGASSVAVGDFDGDGRPDLAVAHQRDDGGVSVLLGNGDGSFQVAVDFAAGTGSSSVAVGEFNGDGHPDLAVANSTGDSVSVLLGRGDGTFRKAPSYPAGIWSSSVAAGEFNGDGVPDLAVGVEGGDGSVSILLGNGDGTFQPARTFPAGDDPVSVTVGDFNGDGRQDLVVANYFGITVSVLLGNGDGTFQAPRSSAADLLPFEMLLPSAVAVGEFNGDGIPDLAVGHDRDSGGVSVLLGNGDGTFQATGDFPTGSYLSSVAVGDFNGDGHQDLAVASSTYWGEVRVLLGNGDGTFQTAGTFAEGPYRNSVAVGEFNGDGRQDLAVAADDAVYLLVGNGDGTFQTARNVGRGGLDVAPGDFNRDGVSDLAVVEGSGGTRVLLGNGDGTFRTRPVTYMAGASPEALAVEDLDADGWADLAVVNVDSHDVSILRNDGTWTTSVTINQAVGQEDPTAGPTISFDVIFSGPVTGFDAADVDLGASTVGGTLVPAVTGSGSVYTVAVTGMTGSGTVVARIPAGAAMDGSGQATLASISTDNSVTFHSVSPTVTVNQDAGQADPTNTNPIVFLVQFSEPVAGFGTGSVTPGGTLAAFAAVTGVSLGAAPNSYLVAVTVSGSQTGTVTASVAAGAVTDVAGNGNAASTSTDNTVTFDNVPPTATVTPPGGGGGTVGGTAVVFAVAFSEPVVGFTAADVDLAGTTAPGAAASLTDSGDHTHFTVTVTGMATSGTVDVTVDAGVVTDPAGNPNDGSNTGAVDYVHSGSLQFSAPMYSVNEQGAPVLAVTVTRAGGSDGPLSVDYATADGSAVAGADYTAVSGTLSWAAGDAADQTIQIPIPDDGGFEADGAFAVNLSNVSLSGALGSPATATVNVYEEAGLTFAAAAFAGAEGAGADFVVKRTLDTHGVVTIDYATGDGTATAASGDYTPTRGTLTWADGDTADKTVHVAIAADGINEGRETINLTLSSPTGNAQAGPRAAAPITIAPSDGVTIAGSSKITKSTFADADGDRVTVALGGKAGTLTYFLTNGRGPIAEIDLAGTVTLKSTATISVKKPKGGTGDKRVGIGEVDGSGFKSFTAKAGDLTGAGFNLSGYAGSITVGNVENGADFLLPGAVPAAKPRSAVTITAGVIGDGTDITVAARVKSITAIAIGQGTITAPSIGAIKVKGRAATKTVPAISGDFKSDVTISGVGVDPVKGKALGALNVKGIVSDVAIAVAGNVGAAVVGAFRDSRLFAGYAGPDDGTGTFNFPATVGTFRATGKSDGFEDSRVIATAFRAVTITDLDSADPAGPFGFYAHASLGAVTVVGPTKWKYDPARPTPQGLGDFVVQVV